MKNGYKILWTQNAIDELNSIFEYLETNFTVRELKELARAIDNFAKVVSDNPQIFPISKKTSIRKAVIKKFNTIYYRVKDDNIEILSFFSNRQNPRKTDKFTT